MHGEPLMIDPPRPLGADEVLLAMAGTFRERNTRYGDNWRNVGAACTALFPNGLQLRTEADFIRFHLFSWALGKLTRWANEGMDPGSDSLYDAAIYLAMIRAIPT